MFLWGEQRQKFGGNCLRYSAFRNIIAIKRSIFIFLGKGRGKSNLGADLGGYVAGSGS